MNYENIIEHLRERGRVDSRDGMGGEDVRIDKASLRAAADTIQNLSAGCTNIVGIILNKEEPSYKHVVQICPRIRRYEGGAVKYTCPVCDKIGDRHQVHPSDRRCPNCGVNFVWLDEMI